MNSEIPLSAFGLMTVEEACAARSWVPRTVQKWLTDGKLPAVRIGAGKRTVYLLRVTDVNSFTPPPMGRPKASPAPTASRAKKSRKN